MYWLEEPRGYFEQKSPLQAPFQDPRSQGAWRAPEECGASCCSHGVMKEFVVKTTGIKEVSKVLAT